MKLNRRSFLHTSAFGAGGLFATASLPSLAAENDAGQMTPSAALFLGRGKAEQLVMNYVTVEVGATKPFSVLHLSDTHLTAAYDREGADKLAAARRRTRTFGGFQEEALKASLAWAKANCDYVLHTGDLIDWQSEANFDLVKRYFGDSVFGSLGNHEFYTYLPDEKITSEESFKVRSWELLRATYPIDARFSSKVINGVNFVAIDDTFGTIQPDLVERFAAEVKKGLPIVLCLHVPLTTPGIWRAVRRYWYRGRFASVELPPPQGDYLRQQTDPVTRDFIAALKEEKLLRAILTGHEHLFVQERFSPTAMQYVTAGNFMFAAQEVLFV